MSRKLIGAIAIQGLVIGAAHAATDLSGFYAGLTAGDVSGESKVSTSTVYAGQGYFASTSVTSINADGAGTVDPSGFAGGITLGYNWQSGSVVYGIEGDWSSLDVDDSRSAGSPYPCCQSTSYTITQETNVDELATLRARIGIATNSGLFYVTAGWAQAEVGIDARFTDTFDSALETFDDSESQSDVVYGVGYEHSFGESWLVKLEYLHTEFDTVTGTSNNLTTDGGEELDEWPASVFTHTTDLDLDLVRVGVNFRF